MRKLIDAETGEVFDNVRYIRTAESCEVYETIKSKKLFNRSNENFIFLTYKMLKEININKEIFKKEDITKVIYIASFMNYDCKLMLTERTPMSKITLKEKLGLSDYRFDLFYKKLIDNKVLTEKDGYIYFDNRIAFRGKSLDHTDSFTRIYRDNVQKIYESIDVREHKKIAILFLMIPYLSLKYNIVCKNPYETNKDLIEPFEVEELSKLFGYNPKSFNRLINDLIKIDDKNGMPIIAKVVWKKTALIINPRFIYAGNNIEDVGAICGLFN